MIPAVKRSMMVSMAISSETWAIVAATGLGPVLAVGITLWREKVTALYNRRLHVFRPYGDAQTCHI